MSGSHLSTVANAVNLNKNTIAVALLIASTLAFIQRRGKMRALFRLLDGKIFKNRDQAMAKKLEEEDELELKLDCVVCLNCVSPGEKYKILPTCKHGFHVNCIDAWLQRNSTCPLCRCPIPQTPIQYCSISTQDQDFDALISYLLRLLDHIRAWLMDPLNTLSEDCLHFP